MSKHSRRCRLNRYMAKLAPSDAAPKARMILTAFDDNHLVEKEIDSVSQIKPFRGKYRTLWLHVIGLEDTELTAKIGEAFGVHELVLEDIGNIQHRAKVEQYDDRYFVVSHLVKITETLETRQISIFLAHDFVITWQEGKEDLLTPVRERLHRPGSICRKSGPDYLAYVVLDTVIDTYFPALETYGERLEKLEDEILDSPSRENVAEIHQVKRELLAMRRAIWPLREAVNELIRDASSLLTPETIIHIRDCYDHTVQVIDFVETYRELGSDMMDVYLTTISNRMNEVMKVLTIITTIFVPAGLISGIYGMNFHTETSPYNMPELSWYYGYPFALTLMALVSTGTIIFLRWRGWLGGPTKRSN